MKSLNMLRRIGTTACLAALAGTPAIAQPPKITAETLIARAEISDLITRYYYNLGHGGAGSFARFYSEDAEMILVGQSYKGRESIEAAYKGMANSPQRTAYAFNISISNPLITVHGETATAKFIYTEVLVQKQGDPPKLVVQGREYDHFKKVAGEWRFQRRELVPATKDPEGWTD